VAVNEAVSDSPELVNKEPYGEGWLMRIKPAADSQVEALLDADAYQALIDSEEQ
jgi:glycine cleavage system H protein